MMFRLLNSNKGMALPLVLITLVVLMFFSTAIIGMSTVDTKGSVLDSQKAQAYYYAHSGAEALGTYIVENPDNLSNRDLKELIDKLVSTGTSQPFTLSPSDTGSIVINVSRSGNIIAIRSEANYEGTKASVTLKIGENTLNTGILNKAVFAMSNIKMNGGTITGDIAALNNINISGGTLSGTTIYIHPDADASSVRAPVGTRVEKLAEVYDFPEYPFPEFPNYPVGLAEIYGEVNVTDNYAITNNLYYTGGINVSSGGRLEIIREGSDSKRVIRTKHLGIYGGGQVVDIGSGTGDLEIYVDYYLEIAHNTTLTLNIGDGNVIIRTKKLRLDEGGGSIVVNQIGNGNLYIYVNDEFKLTSGSKINVPNRDDPNILGNAKKAFIWFAGADDYTVTIPNHARIAATLHVKEGQIIFEDGARLDGNLISGSSYIRLSNDVAINGGLVYAPNATLAIGNGSRIAGGIICNVFDMSLAGTNGNIEYRELDDDYREMFENVIKKTEYKYLNWE